MTSDAQTPESGLCDAIMAQAHQQADARIQRARDDAATLLARAAADAGSMREARLGAVREEASRRRKRLLATVPVEANRLRSTRVEAVLESIRDEALQRLRRHDSYDYRNSLVALVADAIRQMEGDTFVVVVSPVDIALLDGTFVVDTGRRAGRTPLTVTPLSDAGLADGGVVVRDADGRQIWDNGFPARMERLWPELRRQIAVRAGLAAEGGRP